MKFLSPISGFPACGVWQWEEKSPENLALKASAVWPQNFHRTDGNRNSTTGRCTQSLICTRTQSKKQWPHQTLSQTWLLVLEGLLQRWGQLWLTAGTKTWAAAVWGRVYWCEPSKRPLWARQAACGLQCWVALGQTTNRVGTQPHLSADKWLKLSLSTALPTRGTRPSYTHPWAGIRSSHQEPCSSILASSMRGQTAKATTAILSLQDGNCDHRKLVKIGRGMGPRWRNKMKLLRRTAKWSGASQLPEKEFSIMIVKTIKISEKDWRQRLRRCKRCRGTKEQTNRYEQYNNWNN